MAKGSSGDDGQIYHRESDGQFQTGCDLIDEFLKPQRGETILDLGCGTGRLTMELASRVGGSGHVIGVDPDRGRIEVAKAELAKHNVPVTFVEGTLEDAICLGPFSAIFSSYVFHWFERADRPAIITALYKSLKPEGRLVFQLEPQQRKQTILTDATSLAMPTEDTDLTTGMRLDPPPVWLKLCSEAGFDIEQYKVDEIRLVYPSIEKVLSNLEASLPPFKASNLGERDVGELKERYRCGQGEEILFNLTVLKVVARKVTTLT